VPEENAGPEPAKESADPAGVPADEPAEQPVPETASETPEPEIPSPEDESEGEQ
jgi:hypothetical protein